MLRIFNSLGRKKQDFVPLRPGEVRMYVCGMTVYDYCHIGHGRMMVAFDVVRRWLRASGYRVTYVRNITDIDDKIIRRAAENGESIADLTERNIRIMDEDIGALGVEKPDHEPRATQYVPQMLQMIGRLEKKGLAYLADDGDVNFPVRSFPGYGKLSGKQLDDLRAGERVDVGAAKRDPLDFVLWKHSKPDEPRWPSPWGEGRPGWAIECSAMGCALLGESFDIHGGGQDLQFPHHENEIAQSEGASGKPFVKYWLHNGFVQVDDTKMSKSLGNFFTIRDILKVFDPEVVRFFLVRAHYRSELNYSDAQLRDAKAGLARLYGALVNSPVSDESIDWDEPHAVRFKAAMDDDFNTAEAISELHRIANLIYHGDNKLAPQLRALGKTLGLLQRSTQEFFQGGVAQAGFEAMSASATGAQYTNERIEELITVRANAKKAKDFSRADQVRDELARVGIILEDGPKGTTWRRA